MTMNHNPLMIAKEAQQMAKHAGEGNNAVFQKVALISMCTVAVASASQMMLQLLREINHKDREHGRGR